MEWNNEVALKFLDLFQSNSLIWDPNNPNHKCRNKVHDAWRRIATEMGSGCTIEFLKKKKDSLLASYRLYAKKVRLSKKSGAGLNDVYKPTWFAYDVMDRFLKSKDKPRTTFDSEAAEDNGSEEEDDREELSESDTLEEGSQFQTPRQAENETGESQKESQLSNTSDGVVLPASITSKFSRPSQRKRKNISDSEDLKRKMDTAFALVEKNAQNTAHQENDECEIYGKLVAAKLKKMNERDRDLCMHRIENIFFDMKYQSPPQLQTYEPHRVRSSCSSPYSIVPSTHNNSYISHSSTPLPSPHYTTLSDAFSPNSSDDNFRFQNWPASSFSHDPTPSPSQSPQVSTLLNVFTHNSEDNNNIQS